MRRTVTYKDPVAFVNFNIWRMLDFIRHDIPTSDFYVVLYILVLKKFGYLKEVKINDNEIRAQIQKAVYNNQDNHSELIKQLYSHFEKPLNSISNNNLQTILLILNEQDPHLIDTHFSAIFDDFLSYISTVQGKYGESYIIPKEISTVMSNLADYKDNSEVYNPFTGFGSLIFPNNTKVNFYGQESINFVWAIVQLRLLAHDKSQNYIINTSTINNWNPFQKKFDVIISSPPFGMKLQENEVFGKWGSIKTSDQFFIEKGIEDLKSDGKLIALLPFGFLSNSGYLKLLRQYIIENDWLEYVISLPSNLLNNTGIKTVIVVINKHKQLKGQVRFINSNEMVIGTDSRQTTLDTEKVLSYIKSSINDEVSAVVSNQEIVEQGYDLNVPRYLHFNLDVAQLAINGVTLGELGSLIRGVRNQGVKTGRFVRIRNLNSDSINYNLKTESIEIVEIPNHAYKIEESSLLIALRWNTLKPTFFRYDNEPIYITPDLIAFKVDEGKVDIQYLVNELYSDRVNKQRESFVTGFIPSIKRDDLLRLIIELPSLAEQKAKVKGVVETYFKTLESELQLEKELQGYKDDAFREFASIKHTFRQYLGALKSNVSGTRKFLRKNEGKPITLDAIFSVNLNQTFGQHLNSLEGTIDSLAKLLESKAQSENSGAENLDLMKLIKTAQGRFKNEEKFVFDDVYIDVASFESDGTYIDPIISVNRDDFYILFSNIVSNAVDHGFKDSIKPNIIRTEVSYEIDDQVCVLEISNNGKPMDKAFTLKHLTTRGEKTTDSKGAGTGGADIKNIMVKYNGTFELQNINEDEFPVRYILKFPLVKTIDDEN